MSSQEQAQPSQAAAGLACLQRAAAVPPAERSPEVAAILGAAQLADQINALLPVGADGAAALPDSPAARQRALRAMLKVALADCCCPEEPPQRQTMLDRLAVYMHCIAPPPGGNGSSGDSGGSSSAARGSTAGGSMPAAGATGDAAAVDAAATPADLETLAEVLRLYLTASQCSDDFEGLQLATEAAAMLAAPDQQATVARALRHLVAVEAAGAEEPGEQQAQQQPTLAQLRSACCHMSALSALQVAALSQQPLAAAAGGQQAQQPLTAEQREAVQAAEDGSINELLELEPGNPKGLVAAALASGRSGQPAERVAGLYLSAHRLAAEQRSDWWAALAAARALAHAAGQPEGADADTLAAAVEAFEQAAPTLKRCRRLLPPAWVQQLEASWDLAERLLPAAVRRLQQAAQQGVSAAVEGAATAGAAAGAADPAPAAGSHGSTECAYCGEVEAALRCARCRHEVYCSHECQRSAWKKHKQRCQAAV